jgi:Flp pilus assembly protein TadD
MNSTEITDEILSAPRLLPTQTTSPNEQRLVWGVCIFLAALVFAVFGRTLGHEFVNYDDEVYVNERINGLTWKRVGDAFVRGSADNWDPLTTLSHMLDCQFYGLKPAGHHLTNLLLHTATAILLFMVWRRMTGSLWPSAFVAAVFAIHPLRVESVAWIAERKDVLSGLFFMLTLGAYATYIERIRLRASGIRIAYGCVLLWFALGLMSKPMLVTGPFVLLLLDYWPLQRWQTASEKRILFLFPRNLVIEKIPLVALSLSICLVTLVVQKPAMVSAETIPFPLRISNAFVSCVAYLRQMIYPAGLAVFYPFPKNGWPSAHIAWSALILILISAAAFACRRKWPHVLTGWLWYLGMLVPVIGLVQVGWQARADRYTYLPQIGLYFAFAWTATKLAGTNQWRRRALGTFALAVIAVLSAASFVQASHWRNSESLWIHTLAVTPDNATAHNNLGAVYLQQGRTEEALEHYQKGLTLKPDAIAYNNVGAALLQSQRVNKAIGCLQKSVALKPDYSEAQDNLGIALSQIGHTEEAIFHLQKAIEARPDNGDAHYNLGFVLMTSGRTQEAIVHLQEALALDPKDAPTHARLGEALAKSGRARDARSHYETALTLRLDDAQTCKNLAWLLATCPDASLRDGARAINLAERAVRLSGGADPVYFGPLAAAYAEAGRFADAVDTAQKALQLAYTQNNAQMAEAIQRRMEQYQSGIPARDPRLAPSSSQ